MSAPPFPGFIPAKLALLLICLRTDLSAGLAAIGARLRGRRVRSLNILLRATAGRDEVYELWQSRVEPRRIAALTAKASGTGTGPVTFLVHADSAASLDEIESTIAALPARDDVLIVEEGSRYRNAISPDQLSNALAQRPENGLIIPVRSGDRLASHAIEAFAFAFSSSPQTALAYGDADCRDGHRRVRPEFRPDWNREQALSHDYFSGGCAIRAGVVQTQIEGNLAAVRENAVQALAYLAAFRSSAPHSPYHVPSILYHRGRQDSATLGHDAARMILRKLLPPDVTLAPGEGGTSRVEWPLDPRAHRVTIIIPTRDRVTLLRQCVESLAVLDDTRFELLIVDNGSVEPETHDVLADLKRSGATILHRPGPFNFAALNNEAARLAEGEVLCLVNNDVQFLDDAWLTQMLMHAIRPEIGAVGAKLLYPDGRVQHAGIAIGIGDAAGHMNKFAAGTFEAARPEVHVVRRVSAVTAACMVIEKEKFFAVGGFDEENFAVAFNDVDLCLKLNSAGLQNLYTPLASAIHHESQSRGDDLSKQNSSRFRRELAVLQSRWQTIGAVDPNWNGNLDYGCEQAALDFSNTAAT